MSYRRLAADKIFTGYEVKEDLVLIIDENGMIVDLVPRQDAGGEVEVFKGILSPGLINCHCHLELSHMKGRIPEKTGLVDFVFKVVTERHYTEEEILAAIAEAEEEMLANGIVAVGDICNNDLTLQQKQKGRLAYYNFIEASGWLPSIAPSRFERAKAIYNSFTVGLKNRIATENPKPKTENPQPKTPNRKPKTENSIVPHAPYSVSADLWKHIQPYFENKTVSIHNQETAFEDPFFIEGKGDFVRMYELMNIDNTHHKPTNRSSLQSYYDQLAGARNILLVHNTFTSEKDVEFVSGKTAADKEGNTFFCLCPNANQYIEDKVPPVEMFRKHNCAIVIGTDSLASNWSLNIMDEIKTLRQSFPAISLQEMLRWATSNGAEALGFSSSLGSFEKGKTPGVVLIDEKSLTAKRLV